MANNCYFLMKIVGKKESVEEFIRMISWQNEFSNNGLGRVYSFDLSEPDFETTSKNADIVAACGAGDCAWSVKTAMRDCSPRNLDDETERLNLAIEIWSSEPGIGFQEHYIVCCGECVEDECVDYQEYWTEGATEEELVEMAEELGISVDALKSGTNCNGDYTVGGFDQFADFEDLFDLLEDRLSQKINPSLNDKIEDAFQRTDQRRDSSSPQEHHRS